MLVEGAQGMPLVVAPHPHQVSPFAASRKSWSQVGAVLSAAARAKTQRSRISSPSGDGARGPVSTSPTAAKKRKTDTLDPSDATRSSIRCLVLTGSSSPAGARRPLSLGRDAFRHTGRLNLLAGDRFRSGGVLGLDGRRLSPLRLRVRRTNVLGLRGGSAHDATRGNGRGRFHEHTLAVTALVLPSLGRRPGRRRENQGHRAGHDHNDQDRMPSDHVCVHLTVLLA